MKGLAVVLALLLVAQEARAQRGGAALGREPSPSAKASSSFDLSGYWVSLITQDWRLRMLTPPKGDYIGIPMTAEARNVAEMWDPAKDEADGKQCKSYGAAAIMTRPERLHITWQDDNTLRMDVDAGTQSRIFHFGISKPLGETPTWQGVSLAEWVSRRGPDPSAAASARYLKVMTTHMRAGYLRQNGVPYSERAVLTETYDVFEESDGTRLLIVTTVVEDPIYLTGPLILTAQFKQQLDASGWEPTPCSAWW